MTRLEAKELYSIFLESDWWKEMSWKKRNSVGRCEVCHAKDKLQCHHIRYPAHWFDTTFSDLKVLCRDCHEKEHGISHAVFTPNTKQQSNEWRQGNRKRSWKSVKGKFKKSRKQRITEQQRRERIQGLVKVQWKPWQKFRTTPVHHYVNRGTSSN